MKKVTYIISNINKAFAFEWITERLNKNILLEFILLNPDTSELENFLRQKRFPVHYIKYTGKKHLPSAILKIFFILKQNKTDIIHTHLLDASLCGIIAGKLAGIKTRIHTRHHSTYHHVYHPHAVKYDKIINKLSTHIIAISENVKNILIEKENVTSNKITLIHHGFDLEKFKNTDEKKVEKLKEKYGIKSSHPIIGVISSYTHWKGIQYIIPAFIQILADYPNAKLILCNAKGEYKNEIQHLLSELPKKNYIEIEFENDLFSLYKIFNLVIHTPIDKHSEAFGQVYVEALAAGIPGIFTLSGIANEFIIDKINALVVAYKNSNDIYLKMIEILKNEELKYFIIQNGSNDVNKLFQLKNMINKLELLYHNAK